MNIVHQLKEKVFNTIHSKHLIYNACWEDPAIDRELLKIQKDDQIVVISSAGCNALDYLLDDPKAVHCIDVNPRQNALVALKKALIQHQTYPELYKMFGDGYNPRAKEIINELSPYLDDFSQTFWSKKNIYFTNPKRPFYYNGSSGHFAWGFCNYLKYKKIYTDSIKMLNASSIEEQKAIYEKIEPRLFSKLINWLMRRHITMSLLGVPQSQREMLKEGYPDGIIGFIQQALQQVFTQLPLSNNYFWRAYLTGSYTPNCCPNYLKEEHFETLKNRVDGLHLHTQTLANFLEENPNIYQHFILLDHQDWLAANNPTALEDEWSLILKNSGKGTKILMRSAAPTIDFIPEFVSKATDIQQITEPHKRDRVGTYGSCYVLTVL